MTLEEWLQIGMSNGWCSEGFCQTHDMTPMTVEEDQEFEEGYDPCIPVVRIWLEGEGRGEQR